MQSFANRTELNVRFAVMLVSFCELRRWVGGVYITEERRTIKWFKRSRLGRTQVCVYISNSRSRFLFASSLGFVEPSSSHGGLGRRSLDA